MIEDVVIDVNDEVFDYEVDGCINGSNLDRKSNKELIDIISKNWDFIYSKSFRLTKDIEDAEDLTQDTIYRAIMNIDKYNGGNIKGWLVVLNRNLFINSIKKKSYTNELAPTEINGQNSIELSSYMSSKNLGETNLILEDIFKAIDKINVTESDAFMKHYQGYKYDEISDIQKVPLGTVKSRIFLAKKRLQHMLK